MARGVRYEKNEAGVRALLLSPGMTALAVAVAAEGKAHAEKLSSSFKESGTYARSFRVQPVTIPKMGRMDTRAGAILVNDAPYSASLEFRPGAHKVLAQTRDHLQAEFGGRKGRRR